MAATDHVDLPTFMQGVAKRNPGQTEFIQAVQEVAEDIFDFIEDKERYHKEQILRRIAEPDRIISFRVCWKTTMAMCGCSAAGACKITTRLGHIKAVSVSIRPSLKASLNFWL